MYFPPLDSLSFVSVRSSIMQRTLASFFSYVMFPFVLSSRCPGSSLWAGRLACVFVCVCLSICLSLFLSLFPPFLFLTRQRPTRKRKQNLQTGTKDNQQQQQMAAGELLPPKQRLTSESLCMLSRSPLTHTSIGYSPYMIVRIHGFSNPI